MIAKTYSELVPLIYDAAIDNSKWSEFCNKYYKLIGSPVQIAGHDFLKNKSLGVITAGYDTSLDKKFHDYYAELNPWMHMNMGMQQGALGFSDEALPRKQLYQTEFYNDWLKHQEGLVGGFALMAFRDGQSMVTLTSAMTERTENKIYELGNELLPLLAPHLQKSIELSRTISTQSSGLNTGLYRQLDHANYAVITIRSDWGIAWHNKAAENLFYTSSILSSKFSRLSSTDTKLRRWLQTNLTGGNSKTDHDSLDPMSVVCRQKGNLMFHWHRLTPEGTEHNFPEFVWSVPISGMLVVTGIEGLSGSGAASSIAKLFGASPSEIKLADSLLSGMNVYEHADAYFLSKHTARNQMRSLLTKTGTRNQQEFLMLLLKLASPFKG